MYYNIDYEEYKFGKSGYFSVVKKTLQKTAKILQKASGSGKPSHPPLAVGKTKKCRDIIFSRGDYERGGESLNRMVLFVCLFGVFIGSVHVASGGI